MRRFVQSGMVRRPQASPARRHARNPGAGTPHSMRTPSQFVSSSTPVWLLKTDAMAQSGKLAARPTPVSTRLTTRTRTTRSPHTHEPKRRLPHPSDSDAATRRASDVQNHARPRWGAVSTRSPTIAAARSLDTASERIRCASRRYARASPGRLRPLSRRWNPRCALRDRADALFGHGEVPLRAAASPGGRVSIPRRDEPLPSSRSSVVYKAPGAGSRPVQRAISREIVTPYASSPARRIASSTTCSNSPRSVTAII